jgi:hypothetical protein
MKKQFVFAATALAVLALSFTSCKKDSDNPSPTNNTPTVKTKTQLISANSWKVTSMVSNGYDIYNIMSPCEKDNFFMFKANGAYVQDEGPTKCDPSDQQVENGLWKFINNESAIVIDGEDTATIITLNADTLKVEIPFMDDEGKHSSVLTTFVKK